MSNEKEQRGGLVWGTFIGDALAMPVHWYYDRDALHRDYGRVTPLQCWNAHLAVFVARSSKSAVSPFR